MTLALVFLSAVMATVVWWLFRQTLHVQPWNAQAVVAEVRGGTPPAIRTALLVFLGVATSLFVLFISAYAMRLGLVDWTPLPRPQFLVLTTALLVAASLAMEWTVHAGRRGDVAGVRRGLALAGVLTFAFIAGQLHVWKQMVDAGYLVSTSAATAFFYLFTAVHGLHVIGGLVAWARAWSRAWHAGTTQGTQLLVRLCATYWHFLLAVWLVLYALLVSERIGLAICSQGTL